MVGQLGWRDGGPSMAQDVIDAATSATMTAIGDGAALVRIRAATAGAIRRLATLRRDDAAAAAVGLIDQLIADGRLVREGDMVRPAGAARAAPDPALATAMDRLEAALAFAAPPSLSDAARAAGCPPEGIRALEKSTRIVVLEPDLAYAMATYRVLEATALRLATREPLTPAALRDATGTSRRYVMAILADLDRRTILRRMPAGHVPGPRAPAVVRATAPP